MLYDGKSISSCACAACWLARRGEARDARKTAHQRRHDTLGAVLERVRRALAAFGEAVEARVDGEEVEGVREPRVADLRSPAGQVGPGCVFAVGVSGPARMRVGGA